MKKVLLFLFITLLSYHSYSQSQMDIFDIARKGTIEQAKEVLNVNPKAFNDVNENGYSPLVLACYRGNNEVAKFLIENGSDINGNSKMGTALMSAIVKGNNEIAKLLINKKADLNAADANGITALIYAVQFGNIEILGLLIANNVDKTHQDKEGKTAFEHAVFAGNEEIINLLK